MNMRKYKVDAKLTVERSGSEVTVDLHGYVYPATADTREDPGFDAEAEILSATVEGKSFELTTEEEYLAEEALIEVEAEQDDDPYENEDNFSAVDENY
jgi:hypothetical protein